MKKIGIRSLVAVTLSSLVSVSSAEINLLDDTSDGWLKTNQNFRVQVDSIATDGLLFFIGDTDVTSFFSRESDSIYSYDALELPLPSGKSTLTVYADSNEVGSTELQVLSKSGFSISKVTPAVEINFNSKLSDSRSGDSPPPDRTTYNDIDSSIRFESEHEKNGLSVKSSSNILSTSNREAALRFGERGEDAPKIDLSEYIVTAVKNKTRVQLGHISQGNHPLLVDNLSNRGLTVEKQIGERVTVGFAAQSGREITGYSDILGFTTNESKIYTGTFGIDLLKERPGGAKLELSYINGTTIAESNFDEGQVPTAEDNSGYGIRLTTTSKSGKLTTDTAYARSRYNNPTEGTLEFNGEKLVDVKPTSDNAYYTNISYQLLQDHKLNNTISTDLSVNLRYSRVDSEYQSLAASPNPDEELKEVGFNGQLGLVGFQAKYTNSRDNLENIASILTTETNSTELSFTTSLKDFVDTENPDSFSHKLLPALSLSAQRVHQHALNSPDTDISDFNDNSHLPNQVNLTIVNDLTWGFDKWDVGYQTEWSNQNNKQLGRDAADFKTLGHSVNTTYRPNENITLGASIGRIRNSDLEQGIIRYDNTYSLNLDWNISNKVTLSAGYNRNRNNDDKDISKSLNTTNDLKLSYQFNLPTQIGKKLPGQAFIRYARQSAKTSDNQQDFQTNAADSAVYVGINLSF